MTTNKRNFGKQAGDLRDCADRRLVLCSQKAPIKSNCYKFDAIIKVDTEG